MSKIILAVPFGVGAAINQPIKNQVKQLLSQESEDTIVYTNQDLGIALNIERSKLIMAIQDGVTTSTFRLMFWFSRTAFLNKWEEVYLVAAKPHIWRCYRDLKKISPQLIVHKVPVKVNFLPDLKPSCLSSWRWWSRELLLRSLPWSVYKRTS